MISETLHSLLYQKIVTEGMSAEQATEETMDGWETAFGDVDQNLVEQLFMMIRPLVTDRAKRIYRNHTRALENRVFSDQPMVVRRINPVTGAISESSEEIINWHEAQKRLLKRMFNLPNGKWVSYEDSTPEDHEQRARWQRGRADSITKDANRHEALADIMRRHGVDRLGDLDVDLWRELVD